MGTNIFDEGGVCVRRIAGGSSQGIFPTQPAIVIATDSRARNSDYVVLTLEEMRRIVRAMQAHFAEE